MREAHPPGPLRIGQRFKNKYDVLSLLGAGGQGAVFRARHCITQQEVAIKVIAVIAGSDGEAMIRGVREAQSQARMQHPNFPRLFDAELEDGFLLLIMEYLNGRSYKAALKEHGRLNVEEALEISLQIAQALAFMHQNEVIHRDVKPENIYLARGNCVKILDLGIAKVLNDKHKTQRDVVLGTRAYVAPEQLQGHPVTPHCDQFAFGVVMCLALAGIHPIDQVLVSRNEASSVRKRIEIQCLEMPTLLSELGLEIPLYVAQVVQRLIAKEPSQRFASMSDVVNALRECLRRLREDMARMGRRSTVRDLSVAGNVLLVAPTSAIHGGPFVVAAQPEPASLPRAPVAAATKRDSAPSASWKHGGPGGTEPMRAGPPGVELQEPRQVAAETRLPEVPVSSERNENSTAYGPNGTHRVAQPPLAKYWADGVPAPVAKGREPAPVPEALPIQPEIQALEAAASQRNPERLAPVKAAQPRLAEEKPRTPAPMTFGVRTRGVRWASLRQLVGVGLLVGVVSTSIVALGSWLTRSPSVAKANVPSPAIASQPVANPTRPTEPLVPTESEQPTAVAVAAPVVTVEPSAPLVVATSSPSPSAAVRRPSSPKVPALSASQQAHQNEVQRMRERMRDLDLDLKKNAKGAPWW